MMLVTFNDTLHYVFEQHYIVTPESKKSTQGAKKRKAAARDLTTVYLIADCTNLDERFMVNGADCTDVKTDVDYGLQEALEEFLTCKKSRKYLKCSYATSPEKNYYISSIDKIMQDGMLITLRDGEVRHFKFAKTYIACGDGVISDDY